MKHKGLKGGLTVVVAAIACAAAYHTWNAPPAQAAPTARTIVVTGTDASGNFQVALEDARVQADLFFGMIGADIRYTYEVIETTGERGGFVFFNNIFVKIKATG